MVVNFLTLERTLPSACKALWQVHELGVHVHSPAQMLSFPLPSFPLALLPLSEHLLLLDYRCPSSFSRDLYQEPCWTERGICFEDPETLRPQRQKGSWPRAWVATWPAPHLHLGSCLTQQLSPFLSWLRRTFCQSLSLSWETKESIKTSRLPGLVPLFFQQHLGCLLTLSWHSWQGSQFRIIFASITQFWLGY